jgi:hypothetical protein
MSVDELSRALGLVGGEVWVAMDCTVSRYDGAAWHEIPAPLSDIRDVWGTTPDDVWLAGSGTAHWDGRTWREVERGGNDTVLGGDGRGELWSVGFAGSMRRRDAGQWQRLDEGPRAELRAGWEEGSSAWVAGSAVLTRDPGGAWRESLRIPRATFSAVAGTTGEVWAFANGGAAARRGVDGAWQRVPGAGFEVLRARVAAVDDVWAIGAVTSAHWDGSAWTSVPLEGGPPPWDGLGGAAPEPPSDRRMGVVTPHLAVGAHGRILRYVP